MKIKAIFDKCYKEIGSEKNSDIKWYLNERPKTITRDSFFEASVFAIWVSGLKRKSVVTFLENAESKGFSWDFTKIAKKTSKTWEEFKKKLHDHPVPLRASGKWDAVRIIAKQLSKYKDDNEFRIEFFDGKARSSRLDNNDVKNLKKRKIPYIGPANSHFIIRNMGGEAIKCDRWLAAFMKHYGINEPQILKMINRANIPAGLFDLVIWAYCEMFIGKTSELDRHFKYFSK